VHNGRIRLTSTGFLPVRAISAAEGAPTTPTTRPTSYPNVLHAPRRVIARHFRPTISSTYVTRVAVLRHR